MATKYADAIRIRENRSVYNIQEETADEWRNFIPNEQFNEVLWKVLNSISKKIVDLHHSFWLEGTYGTGKSHAAAVIMHLLCDPIDDIKGYIEEEYDAEKYTILRTTLYQVRKNVQLFPVKMYGNCSISHRDELSLQVQSHINKALKQANIDIIVPTDFDTYIENIENNPIIWDEIIRQNAELTSYAPDRSKLIKELRNANTEMLINAKKALAASGFHVSLHNNKLCQWFIEVQNALREQTPYKGILLLWDEFTDVMNSDLGLSLLVDLQEIAEATMNMENDSYFFHIAHPSALDKLKAEERTKTTGRYCYMHYNMEQVSAFKIMSRKFYHENDSANQAYFAYQNITYKYFIKLNEVYQMYAKGSNDPEETIHDLKLLFPVHPGTANLATYYAREVGSSSRSVFEFIGANTAIIDFLNSEKHFQQEDMITADYLWDFVLEEFTKNPTRYGIVVERYNSYISRVEKKGPYYAAVFKVILLLNALNNIANNPTVTPSKENIYNMFAATPVSAYIDEILDWINTQGVVQCSPQKIYEIRFSALDTKEVEEIKQRIISTEFRYTHQIVSFGSIGHTEMEKKLKQVYRPIRFEFYSEDANEYTLLNKIENRLKMAAPYELFVALFIARSNDELLHLKDIASKAATDDRFKRVVFLTLDTIFAESQYEQFIEYIANAQCASKHGFHEQTTSHTDNAKEILKDWMHAIMSGIGTCYIGDTKDGIAISQLVRVINASIAKRIFSSGIESVDSIRSTPITYWTKQNTKSAADNILSFNTKDEIITRCTGAAKHIPLLLQDSVDDNLQFKVDCDTNHPIYLVSRFVKSKIDHSDKQNTFNLADKLRDLQYPPYGLYPSYAGYALLSFALRPYVDKMFTTTGKPITAKHMVDLVDNTFKIWDNNSTNKSKVEVKFQTKEEGQIAKGLIDIFSLHTLKEYKDVTSLVDARWAMSHAYAAEIGYPLWTIKYCNAIQEHTSRERLSKFIDNILYICKEAGLKDPHIMAETCEFITTLRYDIMPLLQRDSNHFEQGFIQFLMQEENVKMQVEEFEDALQYLRQHMEHEIGLWEEKKVIEQLKNWRLSQRPMEVNTDVIPMIKPQYITPQSPPTLETQSNLDKQTRAKEKVQTMSVQEAKDALQKLCNLGYDNILDIILQ